jgi:hypothetical protein
MLCMFVRLLARVCVVLGIIEQIFAKGAFLSRGTIKHGWVLEFYVAPGFVCIICVCTYVYFWSTL